MASKVVFKAQAMARDLEVRLKNRISGLATSADLDADRFPTIVCSIGAKSCFLKVRTDFERSEEDGHVDGLGLGQRVYTPHVVEYVREDAATADASTLEMLAQITAEVSKMGTKVVISEGPLVEDESDFASAKALASEVAVIKSDDIHPLTSQI